MPGFSFAFIALFPLVQLIFIRSGLKSKPSSIIELSSASIRPATARECWKGGKMEAVCYISGQYKYFLIDHYFLCAFA